nr:tail fiber domain-containing protein [Opitutaceae bacterium]
NLDTGGWGLRSGGANRITVEANGRIGLGQANGDQNVQVLVANPSSLNFPFAIATTSGAWFYFDQSGNAFKPTGSTWAVNSDARLKTDIKDLTGSLDQLLRLHGVTFRFKDEARYTAGQQTGFIAQEVEKIFPSWVGDGPDGFKAITVKGFEALTVEALRELRAEKDAQIAALTTRAETAESRLAALEKQVAALTAALSAQR